MDSRSLIRNLLFSFIPLLVFIVAEEIFTKRFGESTGTRYALITAIVLGLVQAAFIFVRERRIDRMVLFDTALILLFGSLSLLTGDDLFFKLKPAIIELIPVGMLAFVAFVNPRLLLAMTSRFADPSKVTDPQLAVMRKAAAGMAALFLAHTGLIAYSAFCLSKESWAFISGGLFYILAGGYAGAMFTIGRLKKRRMMREAGMGPMVELFDGQGRSLGKFPENIIRSHPRIFKEQSKKK